MHFLVDQRFVLMIFISLVTNYNFSESAINNMESNSKSQKSNSSADAYPTPSHDDDNTFDPEKCQGGSMIECQKLSVSCIKCNLDTNCIYGELLNITCDVKNGIDCQGPRQFQRQSICRYCFLSEEFEHDCMHKTTACFSPHSTYKTNCSVHPDVICLGKRQFPKIVKCNWTRGSKYSTALILSITLGGFGVDRFYLGHWQEGIGKLFSFGGLGVWVIVDAILISIGFLGTSDGSLLL